MKGKCGVDRSVNTSNVIGNFLAKFVVNFRTKKGNSWILFADLYVYSYKIDKLVVGCIVRSYVCTFEPSRARRIRYTTRWTFLYANVRTVYKSGRCLCTKNTLYVYRGIGLQSKYSSTMILFWQIPIASAYDANVVICLTNEKIFQEHSNPSRAKWSWHRRHCKNDMN